MISTGLKKLDNFLDGGIKKGIITDIFGAAGTGKTQFIMQISANSLSQNGKIFYQDNIGTFRPERMLEIIKQNGLNSNTLDNIKVARTTNSSEQIRNLSLITNNFSLIVIDGITDLFSFEYFKKEKVLEKNVQFMKYMHSLSSIALEKQIPIVVTNMAQNSGDIEYENLSKSISFFTHLKIHLKKKGNKFLGIASLPFKKLEFSYVITSKGLDDPS